MIQEQSVLWWCFVLKMKRSHAFDILGTIKQTLCLFMYDFLHEEHEMDPENFHKLSPTHSNPQKYTYTSNFVRWVLWPPPTYSWCYNFQVTLLPPFHNSRASSFLRLSFTTKPQVFFKGKCCIYCSIYVVLIGLIYVKLCHHFYSTALEPQFYVVARFFITSNF